MKGVSVHQLIKHVEKLQGSHDQKTMIVGTRLGDPTQSYGQDYLSFY